MLSRERLLALLDEQTYPMTMEELINTLGIPRVQLPSLDRLLAELESEGAVIRTRYGRYGVPHRMNLLVGRLQGNAGGFAFLIPDNRDEDDVFIPASQLNTAMHEDRVIVRLVFKPDKSRKREGEVIRILERARSTIVGSLEMSVRNYGFVVPDEKRLAHDFFVSQENLNGAKHGDKVVARITEWPSSRRAPEVEITEVLGQETEKGVDILSIIRRFELPEKFPDDVLQVAKRIPQEVRLEDYPERRDLTGLTMVTIDGVDARDLDDAVSVRKMDNGNYQLGVHIADVGQFVDLGSVLDNEAYERGTSVYFPDRVVPMLPKELSNGICSLNPQVNRLALSAFIELDTTGTTVNHDICESVIKTDERMTYGEVNRILVDKDEQVMDRYAALVPTFELMAELATVLRNARMARGSIDFDFPEAKVIINQDTGQVVDIDRRTRTLADSIIEEFMLRANEVVAENFYWLQTPFVYRVHEEPNDKRIEDLNKFLGSFGFFIKGASKGEVHPRAIQDMLNHVKGRREENLVHTVVLRTMKRAEYSPNCNGHFGLAAPYYTHFTSPIRRYPDLVIHRIIKQWLRNGLPTEDDKDMLAAFVAKASEQASRRERVADEAEREAVKLKKVEYMLDKVGEVYEGIISGVIASGFFVELPNSVEGFVHVSALADDYYVHDEQNYRFMGQATGNIYRLGDQVKVRVSSVDIDERKIFFTLMNKKVPKRSKRGRRR